MPIHAFVDESIRRDRYLLCAALIPPERLTHARSLVRGLCLPGQRRWHFAKEPDGRRRLILAAMARCDGVRVAMFVGRGAEVRVRDECMARLVTYLIDARAGRLVVESRESQDQRDRHCIAGVLRKASAELPYVHMPPHCEPCLWWPDAVAWAFGAGGAWKAMVAPLVRDVYDVAELP
ncbi:hypothetical protein DFR70_103642 [Nocardia tenerifensis]|uniref:DUF3800 domain-containing protein n=1 Tax=Nocardia tenerifensis TaxID=228006 RepID=A0A318KTQ4_9NOCA|nr:hypothetical protein [Nocardia tenerifensis]PXX66887.1 hypothetical protein DFR70_103642 [Nocardia tenerifensis]